jgi:hypothetical protein
VTATYDVHCSGGLFTPDAQPPYYPDLLTAAGRDEAERFAIGRSAADADGRTYVITSHETWRIVAEYRRGELRLDRPHDRRAPGRSR